MNRQRILGADPYRANWELGRLERFDIEQIGEEWAGETSLGTPDYIRWVQQSLNQILGLRLAVDGRMGPQTGDAIRGFQRRQGLAVDGAVGPKTTC